MFKEYVTRLVHAQEHHLKVTRKAAHREARHFMDEQFVKVKQALKEELLFLHRQNQEMFEALKGRDQQIVLLNEKVRNRENTISELTAYTRHMKRNVLEQDLKTQQINLT